jgi:uncharacterized membrane protein HdeD (DUF308 family)
MPAVEGSDHASARPDGADGTSSDASTRSTRERVARTLAWFTIARGALALFLGFALLLQRDGTSETLATFMGIYWLTGGILALTFHREIRAIGARRAPIVAGVFGVVAGSAVLIRGLVVGNSPSPADTFLLVGALILATGVTNVASGVLTGDGLVRRRSQESLVLGTLEIVLGTALILSRGQPAQLLLLATTAWALAAGTVLLAEGLRLRRRAAGPSDR